MVVPVDSNDCKRYHFRIVLYPTNYLYSFYILASSFSSSFSKYAKWGVGGKREWLQLSVRGAFTGKVKGLICIFA